MADNTETNSNRIALITGGNRGIGFEIARQLSLQGITVLIGSRDVEKGEAAAKQLSSDNRSVTCIPIDVMKQATIDQAVNQITDIYGRLDILVNNSGVYIDEPKPNALTLDVLRHNFEVNFFGVCAVTNAFMPLLRKSSAGRIVNVSSELASFAFHEKCAQSHFHCAYSASKTALNMFTLQLSVDLKNTKIKVNACTPGLTATELTNYRGHSVEIGAKSSVFLATLPDDGPTGKFFGYDCNEHPW
jgi:NAD(P)-dependent dehydrogenase (short-subunit alcohol dehydrogenase family)